MVKVSYIFLFSFFFTVSVYAQTTVSGRLTGTEGKPISLAHVFLTYPSDDNPISSVVVQKDGKFKIVINSEGLWVLHFTGIFHHEYQIAIYTGEQKNIRLDVKLQTYNYNRNFSSMKVIGNFNGWSIPKAIALKKDQDGKYSAIVDNKSDTLVYRIINIRTGGKVEGTEADGYTPTGVDSKGIEGYNSFLIAKKGKVKIEFDPRKLVNSDKPTSFKFTPANSFESRFANAYATLEDTRQKYKTELYSHIDEHEFGFKFDFSHFIDTVKNLLNSEADTLIKQVYQLSYFCLKYMSEPGHEVDSKTSRETLKIIPPNSIVWSLDSASISEVLRYSAIKENLKEKFVREVLDANPMERTKTILLRDEIARRFHALEDKKILPYLAILMDQFGDSPEALNNGKKYADFYVKLKNGVRAPEFSVKSLSDSSHHFTNDSFKGKYYLLEFWATSSSTSKDELANLKKAYDKYGGEKLTIVSISLDSSSVDAVKFIHSNMEIPWLNAIEEKGLDSKLCKSFEVYSLPKSILINPEGIIEAIGWDLRGSNFLKTLKKYLGE
jgi:peroxiredoxin